jgi:hypothetical protein
MVKRGCELIYVILEWVVDEVMESVVKALPYVLMDLPFIHAGAKLGP